MAEETATPTAPSPAVDYGPDEPAMARYRASGTRRALELGNRGPIRFHTDGQLHPDIADACWRHGFYVFQGVLDEAKLADMARDVDEILTRAPATRGAAVDAAGRPALGV